MLLRRHLQLAPGTVGGALVGLGVDYTVNAGVELVKREEFIRDVEQVKVTEGVVHGGSGGRGDQAGLPQLAGAGAAPRHQVPGTPRSPPSPPGCG